MRELCCFLGKYTQMAQILHDRRSGRSRQISTLVCPSPFDNVNILSASSTMQLRCKRQEANIIDIFCRIASSANIKAAWDIGQKWRDILCAPEISFDRGHQLKNSNRIILCSKPQSFGFDLKCQCIEKIEFQEILWSRWNMGLGQIPKSFQL